MNWLEGYGRLARSSRTRDQFNALALRFRDANQGRLKQRDGSLASRNRRNCGSGAYCLSSASGAWNRSELIQRNESCGLNRASILFGRARSLSSSAMCSEFDDRRYKKSKKKAIYKNNGSYQTPAEGRDLLASSYSVKAALSSGSRNGKLSLYLQNNISPNVIGDDVIARSMKDYKDFKVKFVSKGFLDAKSSFHRGAVLECSSLDVLQTAVDDDFWKNHSIKKSALLLDQVQDPNNLGAILRTSYFLGIDYVLLSAKKTAPLSEAVSRTSCGALELMAAAGRIRRIVGPTEDFLGGLMGHGWRTVASVLPSDGTECLLPKDLNLTETSTLIVFGNEEKGCRQQVLDACSVRVAIPSGKKCDVVDSLNVSSAVAIVASHLLL